MRTKVILFALVAANLPFVLPVHAAGRDTVIFSCVTSSGKKALFQDDGSNVSYSYGHAGSPPDVMIRTPRATVTKFVHRGPPGVSMAAIDIVNGKTTYEGEAVYADEDGHNVNQYYVNVSLNGKQIAHTRCTSAIVDNIGNSAFRDESQ